MNKSLLAPGCALLALCLLPACNAIGWGDWGSKTTKAETDKYEHREPAASEKAQVEKPAMGAIAAEPSPAPAPTRTMMTRSGVLPVVEKGGNQGGTRDCHACAAQGVSAPRADCQVCRANMARAGGT